MRRRARGGYNEKKKAWRKAGERAMDADGSWCEVRDASTSIGGREIDKGERWREGKKRGKKEELRGRPEEMGRRPEYNKREGSSRVEMRKEKKAVEETKYETKRRGDGNTPSTSNACERACRARAFVGTPSFARFLVLCSFLFL